MSVGEKMILNDPAFVKGAFRLIEFYRQYPELAAEYLLNIKLSSVQRAVLRGFWFSNNVIAVMSRGAGKTYLLAVFGCLKALLYPGHRVGLLAPTFRQSRFIFEECKKLWQRSPIFQAATTKPPTAASDNCYIEFKAVGGKNPSIIQAIPLGSGEKIRGSRFFTIICDEFPHIPEPIFNMVIRPMGATVNDPMENVERVALKKQLLARGKITQEEFESGFNSNQIVIASSGYFEYNHMYRLYKSYRSEMLKGNTKYKVFRVPHTVLPEGFLDKDSVESARKQMSSVEFRMEYGAEFISDTDSIYKNSLLESCSQTSFWPQLVGTPGKAYILGVDPARTSDSFAISIFELDIPSKLVHALEFKKQSFPKMASIIENICDDFNVVKIYMDSQGGGHAIRDILAENPGNHPVGPILDVDDPISNLRSGRQILKLCNPSAEWNTTSNFFALRLLENRNILFASLPLTEQPSEKQEKSWDTIQKLKMQLQTIELKETATGRPQFNVPKGEGHGAQKKDLYSAFLLGARCIYDSLWTDDVQNYSVMEQVGFIRPLDSRNNSLKGRGIRQEAVPEVYRERLEIAKDPEGYKKKLLQNIIHKRATLTSPAAVLKPKPKK